VYDKLTAAQSLSNVFLGAQVGSEDTEEVQDEEEDDEEEEDDDAQEDDENSTPFHKA
jgi:hypothetical protein